MKKITTILSIVPLMAMANYNIHSKVWYDMNQDWEQNLNEPGYAKVKVILYNEKGNVVGRTSTNNKGYYKFINKKEGEYSIKVLPPKEATLVTDQIITTWLNENRDDINFGIFKPITYSITGTVWNDENKDWSMGKDERKVKNVTIELHNEAGKKIATTKTNSKGIYTFSNQGEGIYTVKVIKSDKVSIITDDYRKFWIEKNTKNIDFGVFTSNIPPVNNPITRNQLIEMIKNNEDITKVNTSKITNMSALFARNTTFHQDISNWDVSNVTDMSFMFYQSSFNQNIAKWDVSNVDDMNRMFARNKEFNQAISSWNVSNVITMEQMFYNARKFNQALKKWDVSNVITMEDMFNGSAFNQDISTWNVSKVTKMRGMFEFTPFNRDISKWNVSNVTDMLNMFYYARKFNQDISKWNVSQVTNMSGMFRATSFNKDISKWNVSQVTRTSSMFQNTPFNQDISKWNVSKVTDMSYMFYLDKNFNQNISKWDVANVTRMNFIFKDAIAMEESNKPKKFRK